MTVLICLQLGLWGIAVQQKWFSSSSGIYHCHTFPIVSKWSELLSAFVPVLATRSPLFYPYVNVGTFTLMFPFVSFLKQKLLAI